MSYTRNVSICVFLVLSFAVARAEESKNAPAASGKIPKGAKVFVAAMPDGFDTYMKAALADKKVPLEVVQSRDQAEFEITGTSETRKASTAKKALAWDWRSDEEASLRMSNLKSGEVAW